MRYKLIITQRSNDDNSILDIRESNRDTKEEILKLILEYSEFQQTNLLISHLLFRIEELKEN